MTITLLLFKKIVSLFLILLSGFALVRVKVLKAEDSAVLSRLCVYLIAPCSILSAFQLDFTPEIMNDLTGALAAGIMLVAFMGFFGAVLSRILKFDAVEKVSVIYPNAGNLIIPLVSATFGPEWVIFASPIMCIQAVLLWTHAKSVLCGDKSFEWKKILLNVNILAVAAGTFMLVSGLRLKGLAAETVNSVGSMIGPVSMLVAGILIGGMKLKRVFTIKRVWTVSCCRLIVVPLAALALLKFTAPLFPGKNTGTILLIAYFAVCSCSAAVLTQMSQVYGKDAEYAGAINVLTTIGTMVTMPALTYLFKLVI